MTIDEAIRILKLSIRNSREHIRFCYDEKGITALDMAIQALEQEPSVSENPNNCEMRDATPEEREAIEKYIKSISKPTGVKFGALEQEPSGDCISRQAVLNTEYQVKIINDIEYVMLSEVQMKMRKLPSVKPQEPTGHWIYDDIANNWRRDKCGETPKTMGYVGTGKFMAEHFKFCNHCGAKMREPQKGANE